MDQSGVWHTGLHSLDGSQAPPGSSRTYDLPLQELVNLEGTDTVVADQNNSPRHQVVRDLSGPLIFPAGGKMHPINPGSGTPYNMKVVGHHTVVSERDLAGHYILLPHCFELWLFLGRHEVKRRWRSIAVTLSCSGAGAVVCEI